MPDPLSRPLSESPSSTGISSPSAPLVEPTISASKSGNGAPSPAGSAARDPASAGLELSVTGAAECRASTEAGIAIAATPTELQIEGQIPRDAFSRVWYFAPRHEIVHYLGSGKILARTKHCPTTLFGPIRRLLRMLPLALQLALAVPLSSPHGPINRHRRQRAPRQDGVARPAGE